MNDAKQAAWDGREGTVGGTAFGAALARTIADRGASNDDLAKASGLDVAVVEGVLAGERRVGVSAMAAFAQALRLKPIEFLQKTGILGLEAYAYGVDPLYFLPEGQIRYDARIYMREINPRHRVPEGDMTKRNPTLKAVQDDPILDALGRLEIELAYLLRAAAQETGGRL